MACTPVALNGLSLSCGNNLGGISKIYVADIQDIASIDLSGSTVIGIEMVVGKTFAEYTLRKNLSSATYTYNNDDTGSKFVDAAIVAVFTKMDSTMREEIQKLMSSQFYVIVLDNNGNYNLVGYSSGIQTYVYANSVGLNTPCLIS